MTARESGTNYGQTNPNWYDSKIASVATMLGATVFSGAVVEALYANPGAAVCGGLIGGIVAGTFMDKEA